MTGEPVPPATLERIRQAGAAFGASAAFAFMNDILSTKLAEFAATGATRAQATVLLDGVCEGSIRAMSDLRASLGGTEAGRA